MNVPHSSALMFSVKAGNAPNKKERFIPSASSGAHLINEDLAITMLKIT
jgi:hypothetical protein